MNLINRSPNGQISQCKCHEGYKLKFGNIILQLSTKELDQFRNYLLSIDYEYYIALNQHSLYIKKLILRVGKSSTQMALNRNEFLELCSLLTTNNTNTIINNRYIIAQELCMN